MCPLHGFGHRLYRAGELDYFAIYVVPAEVWYIFPAKRLLGLSAVSLTPDRKGYKYERYKEAWWLLLREHKRRGSRTIVPDEEADPIPPVEERSDRRVQ